MRRTPRIHLSALAFYATLAVLLTWPLAANFATHVPGDGIDDPALAWNLWWIKARLVDQLNLDIFHADWMFWPVGINLGFYTLTPLNGLLSIPLQTGLSLVVASNLILLSSFVLSGYGAFLLMRYLLRRDWGQEIGGWDAQSPILAPQSLIPAVCGVIYAFASSKLFYASLGQFNIASSQWIPFTVLYVLRTGERRRWQDAVLAGLFLTLQAWSELTYATFLLIFIGLYALWRLGVGYFTRPRSSQFRILLGFLLTGVVFALGIAPFLWAMLPDMAVEGDFFTSGGGFADTFSADLLGYFAPTRLHPWLGEWVAGLPFANDKGQQIFIGYGALLLAVVGTTTLLRRQRWQGLFWPIITFAFWLLTLGPFLRVAGHPTAIPGPFALVSLLPFFNGNRYPSRYSVMLMLGVAVLVGYGLWGIGEWRLGPGARRPSLKPGSLVPSRIITASFLLVFLLEHLSLPLPLTDFRIPAIYQTIAAEPGDFAVLELPTGWRNGARVLGRSDVLIMMEQWYQTAHGKRLLGGNTSRNPAYKFQYFTDAPLLGDLIGLMNGDQSHIAPVVDGDWASLVARNRAIAPDVLDFLDVRFVVVHVEKSPPRLIRFVEEALPVSLVEEWQGPDWTGADSTIRLYRVAEREAPSGWTVQPATPAGRLYLAEGWSSLDVGGRIRYATRTQPALLLDIPARGGTLTFDVYGPARLAGLRLNDVGIDWVAGPLNGARQEVIATVPPGVADHPLDRLTLAFQDTPWSSLYIDFPTKEIGQPVGETGTFLPPGHGVVAVSAGEEVGDAAHIFLTNRAFVGEDVALGERGYNLIALNAQGDLLGQAVFDTFADSEQSADMAAWIAGWPVGTIVAGAVNDEASLHLGEDAVAALVRLGVSTDLRGRFRWSHAFVGVVGAPIATAREAASLLHPALAVAGMPVDGPEIYGGIGRLQLVTPH
ncbi:MAG: hypothetical protein KF753_06295 [Caldilineaceae bacterium]|nr:hypothetical protein [Caldilineaceae bacterium]